MPSKELPLQPLSFPDRHDPIDRDVANGLGDPVGPPHFDMIDLVGTSQSEIRLQVTGGAVTGAAADPGRLTFPAGFDPHAAADAAAVAASAHQAHLEPVTPPGKVVP